MKDRFHQLYNEFYKSSLCIDKDDLSDDLYYFYEKGYKDGKHAKTDNAHTKIVYNSCYGGFSLSYEAVIEIAKRKNIKLYPQKVAEDLYVYWLEPFVEGNEKGAVFDEREISRDDIDLVMVVEEMGERANGICAELKIKTLPKGCFYRINTYDGRETIEIKSNTKWRMA